jgi:hypothetical protein
MMCFQIKAITMGDSIRSRWQYKLASSIRVVPCVVVRLIITPAGTCDDSFQICDMDLWCARRPYTAIYIAWQVHAVQIHSFMHAWMEPLQTANRLQLQLHEVRAGQLGVCRPAPLIPCRCSDGATGKWRCTYLCLGSELKSTERDGRQVAATCVPSCHRVPCRG